MVKNGVTCGYHIPGAQSGILTVSFSGNWNKNHVLIVADSITVTGQGVGFRAELQDCLMVINFFSLVQTIPFYVHRVATCNDTPTPL